MSLASLWSAENNSAKQNFIISSALLVTSVERAVRERIQRLGRNPKVVAPDSTSGIRSVFFSEFLQCLWFLLHLSTHTRPGPRASRVSQYDREAGSCCFLDVSGKAAAVLLHVRAGLSECVSSVRTCGHSAHSSVFLYESGTSPAGLCVALP